MRGQTSDNTTTQFKLQFVLIILLWCLWLAAVINFVSEIRQRAPSVGRKCIPASARNAVTQLMENGK